MKTITDYITGKTLLELETRKAELDAYCKEQLRHTGPGESPWSRETDDELEQLRRYFGIKILSLDAIGLKHGTDKASSFHNYLALYERYFAPLRDKPINLLEIGIAGGASLRTWLEYFPKAKITGLDHNLVFVSEINTHLKDPRVYAFHGDVQDTATWQHLMSRERFDVVIDDGGHFSHQIMDAFTGAWPLLNPGGLYVIEDLHATYANEEGARADVWQWLGAMIHEINEWGAGQCGRPTDTEVTSLHFYKSLAILGKR